MFLQNSYETRILEATIIKSWDVLATFTAFWSLGILASAVAVEDFYFVHPILQNLKQNSCDEWY